MVIATVVAGTNDPFAAHFDLVLRSTRGCCPLPTHYELCDDLRKAGFRTIDQRRLVIRQPLRAFIGS